MYLMFDGPFDGTTSLPGLYEADDDLAEHLTDAFIERREELEDSTGSDSIYRNDDGSWNRDKCRRVALASGYTGENSICGRWAGDDVRIIGDYANDNYYHAIEGTVVAERSPSCETIEYYGRHPSVPGSGHRTNAKPGQIIETYSTDVDGKEEVVFVEHIEDNGWDDITDSVFAEMARYMPGKFGQLDDGDLEPEIVFGSGSNPDYS